MSIASSWIGGRWPALALLASAAMLAGAHAFERFGGFEPCSLCLRQREVYWAAAGIALAGLAANRFWPRWPTGRVAAAILGLVFLTGAILAAYHAGVEWKFWPGPSTCSSAPAGPLSAAAVLEALGEARKVVPCDEAAWRMFGVSMAGYNALISLGLAGLSAIACARAWRSEEVE